MDPSTSSAWPADAQAQVLFFATAACSASLGSWIGYYRRSNASAFVKSEAKAHSVADSKKEDSLATVKAGLLEETKLVLVVRDDLKMTKGKIAAQCSHAALACYKSLSKSNPALVRRWEWTGQTKVALRCSNESELDSLQRQARSLNLTAQSIRDAGRTQIAAGSKTVLGIGPGPARLINQMTGKLRLL